MILADYPDMIIEKRNSGTGVVKYLCILVSAGPALFIKTCEPRKPAVTAKLDADAYSAFSQGMEPIEFRPAYLKCTYFRGFSHVSFGTFGTFML